MVPRYIFETVVPAEGDGKAQRLKLSDRVRSRDLVAFIEVWPAALEPAPKTERDSGKDASPELRSIPIRLRRYAVRGCATR